VQARFGPGVAGKGPAQQAPRQRPTGTAAQRLPEARRHVHRPRRSPPGDYVWIEEEDNGGAWNQRTHSDGRPHGLDIVRALTAETGIDGDPITGWVTWVRLDWPTPSPASHGKDTAPARDPVPGATTMTSAGQALTGLRDALAALGIATAGLTLTRHNGKLHPAHGPAIGYHGGLYWWPARRMHATRPIYAIHDATDPAGAARRIAPRHQPPLQRSTDDA
jgi:hypothetical protein